MSGLRARRLGLAGLLMLAAALITTDVAVGQPTAAGTPAPPPATTAATPSVPSAAVAPSSASIGVLAESNDLQGHSCTATVVASDTGDVIVTAAHCISGSGAGLVFAPGYQSGSAPYGIWVVQGAYVPSGWLNGQQPQDDVAFLTVLPDASNPTSEPVQAVVGGYPLAAAPTSGESVQVTGYVAGANAPVSCTTKVYLTGQYPTADCAGFAAGTSGGPWISTDSTGTAVLDAIVGGLNQGGCSADTSYSPVFTSATVATMQGAASAATPDVLPSPNSDGC